ncbi:MAG: dihydropteroate synthase [Synergistaceae bacterium]|jgi:dihydropteroate synthase|nr:dihydropteroate synthase [Synergistaceae bacterium]
MRLLGGRKLSFARTLVMGILNITNDSFYAASRVSGESGALARAAAMAENGADIIDIGAESTRPGSRGTSAEAECDALVPVIRSIRREFPLMPISVDTRKSAVASAAIEAGADIINDVSGLDLPEEAGSMAALAAGTGAAYVLMHTKGTPDVMQNSPVYDDLIPEIVSFLEDKISFLEKAGAGRESIIIDPGIGFGKKVSDNLTILANMEDFLKIGLPVLIGASRKGFIGSVTVPSAPKDPAERLEGTAAISSLCALLGVHIVRVHDVQANRRAVDMIDEIKKYRK